MKVIRLKFCEVELAEWGCVTRFNDGSEAPSTPHHRPHYFVGSHRAGHGDDILGYCHSHELAHCLMEERLHDRPSQVLLGVAHGKMLTGAKAAYEEIAAQALQRWVFAGERPLVGGVDWDTLKADMLKMLR